MSSHLEQQPIECLDAIAHEIDKTKDLLSLSLTCKALYSLVSYRHLRFRVISCRLEDPSPVQVWDLLARNKALARSVRVLQIRPDAGKSGSHYILPLDDMNPGQNMKKRQKGKRRLSGYERSATIILDHFIPALKQMTRLMSFSWRLDHRQDRRIFHHDPQGLQIKICDALNSCKNLRSIAIGEYWHNVEKTFFETTDLSGITELDWYSLHLTNMPAFEQALTHSLQNLESLKLNVVVGSGMPGGGHRTISSILERCTWPKLRHLELKGDGVGGGREVGTINRLLARHPSIEVLSLGLSLRFCDLPGASLPNLRALEYTGNNAVLILLHGTPGASDRSELTGAGTFGMGH